MNKLYGLYICYGAGTQDEFLAASNDTAKLKAVLPHRTWSICGDSQDPTLMLESGGLAFPRFMIREIPFIC